VQRVHLGDPEVSQDVAFVAPVDLGLAAGNHLEPAVQLGSESSRPSSARIHGPGLGDMHLLRLVLTLEAVLIDPPLMNHRRLQPDISPQPGIDHRPQPIDLAGLGARLRWRRRHKHCLRGQVLLHRPAGMPSLPGDRADTHTRLIQSSKSSITEHDHPSVASLATDEPKRDRPPTQLERLNDAPRTHW
jgi:hypothetical protein